MKALITIAVAIVVMFGIGCGTAGHGAKHHAPDPSSSIELPPDGKFWLSKGLPAPRPLDLTLEEILPDGMVRVSSAKYGWTATARVGERFVQATGQAVGLQLLEVDSGNQRARLWVEMEGCDFGSEGKEPNQALQTTSVTRSGFGKVLVSDRQRRGV